MAALVLLRVTCHAHPWPTLDQRRLLQMSEGMAIRGALLRQPSSHSRVPYIRGDHRKESIEKIGFEGRATGRKVAPPPTSGQCWGETTVGWRKVTCWEADMPLKGLPSLKKWCQPGPARSPSSPVLPTLPLAVQPSKVSMGPQRPQPVVPHRTPTQACSCTPGDQGYTKETALKSMATRAPGENWFSQSTCGGVPWG